MMISAAVLGGASCEVDPSGEPDELPDGTITATPTAPKVNAMVATTAPTRCWARKEPALLTFAPLSVDDSVVAKPPDRAGAGFAWLPDGLATNT